MITEFILSDNSVTLHGLSALLLGKKIEIKFECLENLYNNSGYFRMYKEDERYYPEYITGQVTKVKFCEYERGFQIEVKYDYPDLYIKSARDGEDGLEHIDSDTFRMICTSKVWHAEVPFNIIEEDKK